MLYVALNGWDVLSTSCFLLEMKSGYLCGLCPCVLECMFYMCSVWKREGERGGCGLESNFTVCSIVLAPSDSVVLVARLR